MTENARPDAKLGFGKKLIFVLAGLIGLLLIAESCMQLAGLAVTHLKKPALRPGAKVIVCIGDSHTYGVMVEKDQTYPAGLEKLLNEGGANYQVINLGAPGLNSTQALKALPEISIKYHPSILIVLVGVNNIWNVAEQGNNLNQYFLDHLKLYKLARIIYFQKLNRKENFKVSSQRDPGGYLMHNARNAEPKTDQEIQGIYMRLSQDLLAIADFCDRHKIRLVLMSYAGQAPEDYQAVNKISQMVAGIKHAPFVDNSSYFVNRLRAPDGSTDQALHQNIFFQDMHLKPLGYSWMAGNILEVLKQQKVLP